MGPLPGRPGDFRKPPWFWGVLVGLAIFLGATALAFAAMTSLRSREREDEKLRESP